MPDLSISEPAIPSTPQRTGSRPVWSRDWPLRLRTFLQQRPVLCLLLLTPGIVEYLSGSSSLSLLILSPFAFLAFLALNLGLYGPGALLIREAMVRWKKGWASVLLLGAAYGILEEGVALNTLFYSKAGSVGALGFYGHWAGVSWVWTSGLLVVHALWSIALPIMLLGLALPQTRGRSLLTARGLRLAFLILGLDVLGLLLLTGAMYHYYAGPVLWAGSFLSIGALVYAAYRAPPDLLSAVSPLPRGTPLRFALLGVAFFPALLLAQSLPMALRAPPYAAVLAVIATGGLWLAWVIRNVGRTHHEARLVALGAGLVVPLLALGVLVQLGTGVGEVAVLAGDAAAVLFFLHLWRKYATHPGASPSSAPSVERVATASISPSSATTTGSP